MCFGILLPVFFATSLIKAYKSLHSLLFISTLFGSIFFGNTNKGFIRYQPILKQKNQIAIYGIRIIPPNLPNVLSTANAKSFVRYVAYPASTNNPIPRMMRVI